MEAMQNLLERRSIRKYKDTQVPDDLLDQVLEAGLYAPSGMNRQNVIMVAVRDKETRDQLMRMNAAVMGREGDPFYGAPCVIVVLGDPENYPVVENGSLVLGNLMNAAHALGLGSCWIHRAWQTFETEEGNDDVTGGEIKFGFDDTNLYFYLEMNDKVHFAVPDPNWWNNDGIQFSLATIANPGGSRQERGTLMYSESGEVFRSNADFQAKIKREEGKTIYEVAYPWSINFGGIVPKSLLANVSHNNNFGGVGGEYHNCAYSITPGIVIGGKNAYKSNPLVLWTPFAGIEYGIISPITMDYGTTRLHEVNLRNTSKESQMVDISIPELNYNKTVTLNAGEKQQIQIPFTIKDDADLYINTTLQVGGEKMNQEN